ncbi:aminodeoxychorismate lyase [Shewanella sp. YIC-542]|uniref:aminodeoxychorismate lyase n=1 Tax=Shewanella mytili TaxID=3377111 RepID=UPI00398F578B
MTAVWVNGQATDKISVFERAFTYGDGLFATMASDGAGHLQFLTVHLQRLQDGAARLGFPWQPSDSLQALLARISAQHPRHCVKLQLSRGVGGRGYAPPQTPSMTEVVSVSPLPAHYQHWQQQGIRLQTSSVRLARQPLLAGMKHLNRLEQVLIKSHPLPEGADDWLVFDTRELLIESSMANVFLLCAQPDNTLRVITPAMNYAGVSGVMRQQVIMALLAMGMDVQVGQVTGDVMQRASHLFISNSLLGTVDVVGVDGRDYDVWPQRQQLQEYLTIQ